MVLIRALTVLCCAVVVLFFASVVLASDSPWDGPPAMRLPGAEMFDDPVFQRAVAAGVAHEHALEQQRSTPAAERLREDSADAFAELDGSEALALAQQEFPALMTAELDATRLQAGDQVVGYESANAATVLDRRGDRSLILSSEPVAVRDDGELQALDLDLADGVDGFVVERPAVEVSLPETADGFTRLQDAGVAVRPTGAEPVDGAVDENRVFFSEIDRDTDYVATPTRAGAEVMWQLRSDVSPQELGLDVQVPEGASLRLSTGLTAVTGSQGSAGVEVVRDGVVVATISAPVAIDADGIAVPAEYRFRDGRVVVAVDHQGGDVRYPVMVDPEVRNVWGSPDFVSTCGGGASNFAPGRWSYQQWVTSFTPMCGNIDSWGNGLFVVSSAGYYGDTARGQWIWSPPAGAYIMSAWFDGIRHTAAGTWVYSGLYGNTWGSVINQYGESTYGQVSHTPDSPYNSWTAVLGLWMNGSWARPHSAIAAVRGVNLRIGDLDPPLISLSRVTGGLNSASQTPWIDNTQTQGHAWVSALDGGLRLRHVGVVRDVTGQLLGGIAGTCAGHRSSPCPRSWAADFDLNLGLLPEGLNAIQTRAIDIVDNAGYGPHWIQRIDRTPPTINISGELVDHATDGQLTANPGIYVHAIDGTLTSAATQRSGVKRVRLLLDGVVREDYVAPETGCDNCDRGLSWTIAGVNLLGRHVVRFEAWDYLGRKSVAERSVISYATSQAYGGVNGSVDLASEVEVLVGWLKTSPESEGSLVLGGLTSDDQLQLLPRYLTYFGGADGQWIDPNGNPDSWDERASASGWRSFLVKKAVQLVAAGFRHGGSVLEKVLKYVDRRAARTADRYADEIADILDDIADIPGLTKQHGKTELI